MNHLEELYQYCKNKKGVTEHFPFDKDVLVFKVASKIFLLTSIEGWEKGQQSINLKCDPDYAQELREIYDSVEPGYHMNKKHWNTIKLYNNELPKQLIKELIDHSYHSVVKSLTKKQREIFQ